MGYDAKGVDSGKPYGVVVRAVPAACEESEESSDEKTLVCKLKETRLLFEDPVASPMNWPFCRCKIRTDCHVYGRLSATAGSREDLEVWLTSQVNIPLAAKEDILRLVFKEEEEEVVSLLIRVDLFESGYLFESGNGSDGDGDGDGNGSDGDGDGDDEYWGEESADAEEEEEEYRDGPPTKEAMDRLERVTTTEESGGGCPICLDQDFSRDKEVVRLPCSHLFHIRCIQPWLDNHCYCPMCRYRLPTRTYKDYPCFCEEYCIENYYFGDESWVPDHPPPYYKFY